MWTKYTSVDKYFQHIFVSEKLPTELTLHSLVRYAQDLGDIGQFRIERNGHLITLTTELPISFESFTVTLHASGVDFDVVWHNSNAVENKQFAESDSVVVSGMISYGMNITGQKGKHCPYWNGKFAPGMKKPFITYLERELGIKVVDLHVNRLPNSCRENKVQLNNLLTVIATGEVVDTGAVSSIAYRSVAQRKSYGLGNLSCSIEVKEDN
jgi:hypothetical protein